MNYCISLDWFQYYCHRTERTKIVHGTYFKGASKDKQGYYHTYFVGACQEFHSMYRQSYTIYIDNQAKGFVPWEPKDGIENFEEAVKHKDTTSPSGRKLSMVHIYMEPKMKSIDPKSVSIKVANRLLYKEDWSWFLHDIIEALHIEIKNITRADICLDFQNFAYSYISNQDVEIIPRENQPRDHYTLMELEQYGYIERYMTPLEFIHRYVQDQTIATTETYVREGSNEYCIYGKKKMIAADGSKQIDDSTEVKVLSDFEYIRFGSRNSGVCTYLYNKSRELRDKKSKPWIRARWEEAGLLEKNGDIFRLEFSISAKGMCLRKADQKRGMKAPRAKNFRKLCRDDVENQRQLEELFIGYLDKYFSFRLVGKQKYRKDMKRITLFDFGIEPKMLPCYYNTSVNCGRAERNAALTLQKLQYTILDLPAKQANILYQAQQVLEHLSVTMRQLKQDDVKQMYFVKYPYKVVPELTDPLVKKALDEVDAIRAVAEETIRDLEQLALQNDSDDKEWWLSDEDSIIAY